MCGFVTKLPTNKVHVAEPGVDVNNEHTVLSDPCTLYRNSNLLLDRVSVEKLVSNGAIGVNKKISSPLVDHERTQNS